MKVPFVDANAPEARIQDEFQEAVSHRGGPTLSRDIDSEASRVLGIAGSVNLLVVGGAAEPRFDGHWCVKFDSQRFKAYDEFLADDRLAPPARAAQLFHGKVLG